MTSVLQSLRALRIYLRQHPEIAVVLVLVALARILPHPWNLTPLGATALFAGAVVDRRYAWMVALLPMAIADALIGFYNPLVMMFVYGSFAVYALFGHWLMGKRITGLRLGAAVLAGSLQFFVLSNFAVWAAGMYGYSWTGLVQCYVMAIPYYGNTLAGDAFYSLVFFAAFFFYRRSAYSAAAA